MLSFFVNVLKNHKFMCYTDYVKNKLNKFIIFKFVWQQSRLAFFGALTSVGALFYLEENFMALINCPECGRQVSDRAISCPDCGCPISAAPAPAPAPAAAPVQQNNFVDIEKLLVLAQRARESFDSKNAKRYYDQILTIDPGQWEAIFYSVYFEAVECKLMHLSSAANSVANCIYSTFAALEETLDASEYDTAIDTIVNSATSLAWSFAKSAVDHYNQFSTTNNASAECRSRVNATINIYAEIENGYKTVFPQKVKQIVDFQKRYKLFLDEYCRWAPDGEKDRLIAEISALDPAYGRCIELNKRRIELNEEIKSLDSKIEDLYLHSNNIVTDKKQAKGGCFGWFFIIGGIIMIVLGFLLKSLDDSFWSIWPFLVAIPEFIIGAVLKKKPSKSLIKENIKKKEEIAAQINDLQRQRDDLQRQLDDLQSELDFLN